MRVKLGDVCTVISGSTPKTGNTEFWDGDIDWITPAELTDESFIVHESVRKITQAAVVKTGLRSFPAGTVILSSRAPIGKVAIAGKEMYCNQGFKNLICGSMIHHEYLYWFLKGKTEYLNALGRGATFKEISKSIVEKVEIPLPAMPEQMKCAATFKAIWGIINLRKQQLAELDNLVKARFVEQFGDPVANTQSREIRPFKAFMLNIRYGTSQPPSFSADGEFKFIRATNIKAGRITENDMLRISADEASKIEKCRLNGNEIIIVRSGANTGDTCVVTDEYRNQYAGYDIIITLNPEVANPVFFNELMNTHYMQAVIKPLTVRAAQPHINSEQVQNLPMLTVSLQEQEQFAAFVLQSDKSKFAVQQALDKTQQLFDSLMQEYFG